MKTIWVDMDGVIADFDYAKSQWKGSSNQFFKHMIDTHGFANLEILPCEKLMNRLEEIRESHGVKIKILSSYGRPENLSVRDDKEKWLSRFPFRFDEVVFVPGKEYKRNYATPDSILIDDTPSNVFDFIDAGGLAILHKSQKNTINYLDKIFGM